MSSIEPCSGILSPADLQIDYLGEPGPAKREGYRPSLSVGAAYHPK